MSSPDCFFVAPACLPNCLPALLGVRGTLNLSYSQLHCGRYWEPLDLDVAVFTIHQYQPPSSLLHSGEMEVLTAAYKKCRPVSQDFKSIL